MFYSFSVGRGGVVEIVTPLDIHDIPRKFLSEKFLYSEKGFGAVLIDYKMTDKNKKERLKSEVGSIYAKIWKFKERFAMPIIPSWSGDNIKIFPMDYLKQKLTE